MNNKEAKQLLGKALLPYRERSYQELQMLLKNPEILEITSATGTQYQLEIQAIWDDKEQGNLRICGSIDDGGWRAWIPLTDDFIISPAGKFLGET